MSKPLCSKCGKIIKGAIKFETIRKKIGEKIVEILKIYDEKCFTIVKNKRVKK